MSAERTRVMCPICNSDSATARFLAKSGYDLHRCAECDHLFVHPLPSADELVRLYSFAGGYQTNAACDQPRAAHPKFVTRVSWLQRHREGGRLLDVGCSYGEFLGVARAVGFDVEGVELSRDTAALTRAKGIPVFAGSLAEAHFPDASFDIVHAGDVIEHLVDAHGFVAEVQRVLRPGGLFAVATPNHDAFFPRATLFLHRGLGIPWSHATPPFHLHQFSTRSLTRLLAAHDLAVVDTYHVTATLGYEIRATGCFSSLKRAAGARDVKGMLAAGLPAGGALALYPLVWLAGRALGSARGDATVNVIAVA